MLRHSLRVLGTFREVARQFITAFCFKFVVNLLKNLAGVGVRLKKEVFMTSR